MFENLLNWVSANSKGLGAVTVALGGIITLWKKMFDKADGKQEKKELSAPTNANTNNVTVHNYVGADNSNLSEKNVQAIHSNDEFEKPKQLIKILFIDDDTKFKVVSILKKAGWNHAKSVKDIDSTDCDDAKDADIFFVDIQGVGIAMGFKDEGLGLALALKKKYPNKKVVIYSAEQTGVRFHAAFNMVDYQLAKDADPYEFQNLVEGYSQELLK